MIDLNSEEKIEFIMWAVEMIWSKLHDFDQNEEFLVDQFIKDRDVARIIGRTL